MPDLFTDLVECLALTPASDTRDETQSYSANNQALDYRRIFGGQLLAQFVTAARLSCPDKMVKSLHTVFPREGRAEQPLRYTVTRQHEGRSFGALAITATQDAAVVGTATVSMHVLEDGPEQQDLSRCGGPLPTLPGPEHRLDAGMIPWETRATVDLDDSATGPAEFELWMRTPPVAADLAPALTAYATDLTLIGTALRPVEGFSQRDTVTGFASAVTSHTVWFHRQFRCDDWLLLRQHSPIMAGGRSFGRGDVFAASGALVASYAQEALIRFKSDAQR